MKAEPKVREAIARSALYKAFSLALSPPTAQVRRFIREELGHKVMEALKLLPIDYDPGEELARLKGAAAEEGLEGEYNRLFRTGIACSPYETEYDPLCSVRKGQELSDILAFYTAFGLRLSDNMKELPDHIAAELEFMSLLHLKEVYARLRGLSDEMAISVEAQGKFLKDHLGRWVFSFCRRVERSSRAELYKSLSRLLSGFIGHEIKRRGLKPCEMDTERPATDEELTCPFVRD